MEIDGKVITEFKSNEKALKTGVTVVIKKLGKQSQSTEFPSPDKAKLSRKKNHSKFEESKKRPRASMDDQEGKNRLSRMAKQRANKLNEDQSEDELEEAAKGKTLSMF